MLEGHVLSALEALPANSFDCVVTSPPYWGLRDYGCEGQIGLEPTLGEHLDVMLRVFRAVRRVMKPSGTLWLNYGDCYASNSKCRGAKVNPIHPPTSANPFPDAPRRGRGNNPSGSVLKPKDLCMIPNRLAIALQEDGWWVRSEIIWGKTNPMPDSSGRYRPSTAHEKIFMLAKSVKCFYDSDAVKKQAAKSSIARWAQNIDDQNGSTRANAGIRPDRPMKAVGGPKRDKQRENVRLLRNYEPADLSIWAMSTASFGEAHFATFPPELAERCIKAGCPEGGSVLDPFGGSGTTAMVAATLGRSATIIELNPEYCRLATARIEASFMGRDGAAQHMAR